MDDCSRQVKVLLQQPEGFDTQIFLRIYHKIPSRHFELYCARFWYNGEGVRDRINRNKDGFQVMETIRPFFCYI